MSKYENEAEREARELFESMGFSIERIAAHPNEQRADYLVSDSDSIYIVEVKSRVEDEDFEQVLLEEGQAERLEVVGRTNSISSCIRNAARQLEATPAEPNAFRIITLVALGTDPRLQSEQFRATLYGTVHLLLPSEDEDDDNAYDLPCFYGTFNEFFELPQLDAALIIEIDGSKRFTSLCLNTFSARASEFQQSELWKRYAEVDGACHPELLEEKGEAYVVDGDVNRHDETEVKSFLRRKYKLEHLPVHLPIISTPKKFTAAVRVNQFNH